MAAADPSGSRSYPQTELCLRQLDRSRAASNSPRALLHPTFDVQPSSLQAMSPLSEASAQSQLRRMLELNQMHSEEIIDARVSQTAAEFEQEIIDYTSSNIFAADVEAAIATAETEPLPSDTSIEALWTELNAEIEDSPVCSEFDQECQAGFVSSTKAIDAANRYA